jgi:hypothetical protein
MGVYNMVTHLASNVNGEGEQLADASVDAV